MEINHNEIKKQLLNRFGFTEDGGVDAENQLKIFSFMDWFKQYQIDKICVKYK